MNIDLPLICALIIAFAIFAYVVLDGFDLGIGILYPLAVDDNERDTMMNSVAPVWDGNETWLVLGGGGLLAAFPLAYATLLPALYGPIIAMLLGLIFRGVAFEFRYKASPVRRWIWDYSFFAGSLVATLCQGLALGAFLQGIKIEGRGYAGGWFDWLTPFSVTTAVAMVAGYALLGATWLVWKTEGEIQQANRLRADLLASIVLTFIGVVSLWSPFLHPDIHVRWLSWPNTPLLAPIPLLVIGVFLALWRALKSGPDGRPFLLSLALFALSYFGLAISTLPFVVPRHLTIWDAAAPRDSLAFLLVGAAVLLPIVLAYTGYAYWVFRGKVTGREDYH